MAITGGRINQHRRGWRRAMPKNQIHFFEKCWAFSSLSWFPIFFLCVEIFFPQTFDLGATLNGSSFVTTLSQSFCDFLKYCCIPLTLLEFVLYFHVRPHPNERKSLLVCPRQSPVAVLCFFWLRHFDFYRGFTCNFSENFAGNVACSNVNITLTCQRLI